MSTVMEHSQVAARPKWNIFAIPTTTLPLVILTAAIMITGIAIGIVAYFNFEGHWMEAPSIAILVVFMPLTAISFLHFRLPKKMEEFAAVKRALNRENDASEIIALDFDQEESDLDYLLPVSFVTFFSVLGFYILVSNNADVLFNGMDWVIASIDSTAFHDTTTYRRSVVAIGMAFLGAYIWSIQYIFRRMMTLDLPPGAYYSVGSRMVYSAFLAVVIQHFLAADSNPIRVETSGQLVAISFLIGIFPDRALTWMKDSLGHIFTRSKVSAQPLPLEMLEGISGFHKSRLSELGIDNVQNLAQASLMELILKTPFRPRVLIDWMAQARLCLEFKEKTAAIRNAGVRTILDLLEIDEDEKLVQALAANSEIELSLIQTVCHANREEVSVQRLRKAYDALNLI